MIETILTDREHPRSNRPVLDDPPSMEGVVVGELFDACETLDIEDEEPPGCARLAKWPGQQELTRIGKRTKIRAVFRAVFRHDVRIVDVSVGEGEKRHARSSFGASTIAWEVPVLPPVGRASRSHGGSFLLHLGAQGDCERRAVTRAGAGGGCVGEKVGGGNGSVEPNIELLCRGSSQA